MPQRDRNASKSRHNVTPTVKAGPRYVGAGPRYVGAAQDNNLTALKTNIFYTFLALAQSWRNFPRALPQTEENFWKNSYA
jgi:hypothetical protein